MKANRLPYAHHPVHNDSRKFAVIIDDRFGYVDSRAAAEEVSRTACPEDIGSSAHGYICIYPPGAKDPSFRNLPMQNLSNYQEINILDYAKKHGVRSWERRKRCDPLAGLSRLPQRLESYKTRKEYKIRNPEDSWDWIFEDEENWTPWTVESAQAKWLQAVPKADLSQYHFEKP